MEKGDFSQCELKVKADGAFLLIGMQGITSCNSSTALYTHTPVLTQSVHSIDYGGAAPHSHHLVVLVHTEVEMCCLNVAVLLFNILNLSKKLNSAVTRVCYMGLVDTMCSRACITF